MRIIGLACLAIAAAVVVAGATVGGVIGAAGLSLVRSLNSSEPIVTNGPGGAPLR